MKAIAAHATSSVRSDEFLDSKERKKKDAGSLFILMVHGLGWGDVVSACGRPSIPHLRRASNVSFVDDSPFRD
jgi:hypothetical protein